MDRAEKPKHKFPSVREPSHRRLNHRSTLEETGGLTELLDRPGNDLQGGRAWGVGRVRSTQYAAPFASRGPLPDSCCQTPMNRLLYFTLSSDGAMAPRHPSLSVFSWSAHRNHRMLLIAGTDALSLVPLLAASLPCVPTFSREIYYNR